MPGKNEAITAGIVPVMVSLTVITVNDDIAQLPAFDGVNILQFAASLQAYTSGTYTVNLKNGAGTVLATVNLTAAGLTIAGSISVPAVAKGDKIRVGLSAVGVGAVDLTVSMWLRVNPQSI